MHTGARARKQKYISIYISLYIKTFSKTGVYIYIYIYIYITCTEENRLSTNKNFIQTQRVSASAFIRGPYVGFINQLMISYCDVIKKCSLLD